MASIQFNLSDIKQSIRDWEPGVYEAVISNARVDIAKSSGDPMLVFDLTLYSPVHGEITITDRLPSGFPAKGKAFWKAFNDYEDEDLAGVELITIENPAELEHGEILVQLGDQEDKRTGKMYRQVVAPWYYPTSMAPMLLGGDDLPL